ncbi:hypothetical protein JCM19231_3597 [Vibrio ishigakensis]|uniref:Uncharacterized protein n=1 Tax=Vibrio ishigakensis TaxID=1481914 RepID=A0A0B8NP19_9VIBR|nr:hypothetical protein JCM19231_3597 [Vibrio ishigakensis]
MSASSRGTTKPILSTRASDFVPEGEWLEVKTINKAVPNSKINYWS